MRVESRADTGAGIHLSQSVPAQGGGDEGEKKELTALPWQGQADPKQAGEAELQELKRGLTGKDFSSLENAGAQFYFL